MPDLSFENLIFLCFLGFLINFSQQGHAQTNSHINQFLRLENVKNAKTKRFYVGQKLRYKEGGDKWKKGEIESFDFIQQVVHFNTGPVRIKDIEGIQTMGQYSLALYTKYKLMTFGAAVLFYSVFNPIAGMPYPLWALPVGGGALAAGYLAGVLLNKNYHRIGNRWRLQLLDLSFK